MTGPAPSRLAVADLRMKLSAGNSQPVSGAPWSGQPVKWNCDTVIGFTSSSDISYTNIQHRESVSSGLTNAVLKWCVQGIGIFTAQRLWLAFLHVIIRLENYNTRPRSGITFLVSFTTQQWTSTSASWKHKLRKKAKRFDHACSRV